MKLLFLENTEHNKVGEVKDVPDGFARNIYYPRVSLYLPLTKK
jgi:ribosomal protein L9